MKKILSLVVLVGFLIVAPSIANARGGASGFAPGNRSGHTAPLLDSMARLAMRPAA